MVLGFALVLSIPSLWRFVTGQANATATLVQCVAALLVAWVGLAIVKAVVVTYLPEPEPEPLYPYGDFASSISPPGSAPGTDATSAVPEAGTPGGPQGGPQGAAPGTGTQVPGARGAPVSEGHPGAAQNPGGHPGAAQNPGGHPGAAQNPAEGSAG